VLAELQDDFPLVERPYAELARRLSLRESDVLKITRGLLAKGLIRRIGPVIDPAKSGRVSTLVAARVPPRRIGQVARIVNALAEVSHNYLRKPHAGRCPFNMWFTLSAGSRGELGRLRRKIAEQARVELVEFPATRMFKIKVQFDLAGDD